MTVLTLLCTRIAPPRPPTGSVEMESPSLGLLDLELSHILKLLPVRDLLRAAITCRALHAAGKPAAAPPLPRRRRCASKVAPKSGLG